MKDIWNRFTAWLSGWPESKAKKEREVDYLFKEEEYEWKRRQEEKEGWERVKVKKKPKGLDPKKKTFWNHGDKNDGDNIISISVITFSRMFFCCILL